MKPLGSGQPVGPVWPLEPHLPALCTRWLHPWLPRQVGAWGRQMVSRLLPRAWGQLTGLRFSASALVPAAVTQARLPGPQGPHLLSPTGS